MVATLFEFQFNIFKILYDAFKKLKEDISGLPEKYQKMMKDSDGNLKVNMDAKVIYVLMGKDPENHIENVLGLHNRIYSAENIKILKNLSTKKKQMYQIINIEKTDNEAYIDNEFNKDGTIKLTQYLDWLLYRKFTLPMWWPSAVANISKRFYNQYNTKKEYATATSLIVDYFNNKNNYNLLILKAQTGTGKSVIVPGLLLEAGYGREKTIVCTQPRRLNAESITNYVAKLLGAEYGETIGFHHGGEEISGKKLLYVTDGLLIKQLIEKPINEIIEKYSCIVLDEVHERSVDTDMLLAMIKKLKNTSMKIIITSATFDAVSFAKYYGFKGDSEEEHDHILIVEGRTKKIDQKYLDADADNYIDTTCKIALSLHQENLADLDTSSKDIIIFIDSTATIRKIKERLQEMMDQNKSKYEPIAIMSLTSKTPESEKIYILKDVYPDLMDYKYPETGSDYPKRRIIIATNTAETGVTFEYAKYVIDTGWMNVSVYNPNSGATALVRSHITMDNLLQRMGRVGRRAPGQYYAVFTEKTKNQLEQHKHPSIYFSDLSYKLPEIISYISKENKKIMNIYDFDFIDPPPITCVNSALSKLFNLNVVDNLLHNTKFGEFASKLQLEPSQAKALLTSFRYGCSYEVSAIIALIQTQTNNSLYTNYGGRNRNLHSKVTYNNYKSDHINILITYLYYLDFKRTVNSNVDQIKNWCIVNSLTYNSLENTEKTHYEILERLCSKNFPLPIVSFNTSIFNDKKINNILKSLFAGYCINTARKTDNMMYYKIDHKDIYAQSYKSLIYKATPATYGIIPEHMFYTDLIIKMKDGVYTYYMSLMSEYNPDWFGTITADIPKIMSCV